MAKGLANALASIHKNGVRHNDITAVNVIVSLDANIPVRVIDLGFAELSDSLEVDDCGERVNEDMHALSGLLTEIFSRQELWDANTNISSIVEDKTFSRKFIENKSSFVKNTPPLLISGSCLNSSYDFSSNTIEKKADDDIWDIYDSTLGSHNELPLNLPRSVRQVISDASSYGDDSTN